MKHNHLEHYMQPCEMHPDPWDCADILFARDTEGRYGLPIRDGGESFIVISHCPFCGLQLDKTEDCGGRMIDVSAE